MGVRLHASVFHRTLIKFCCRSVEDASILPKILVRACISQDILIFLIRYYFSVAGPGHFGCWGLGVDGEGHVQQSESPHKHCSRSCLHTDINR
jgi:hypothetical protein